MYLEFNLPAFNPPSLDERKRMATILKSARLTLTTSRINVLYHLTRTVIPSTAFELSKLLNVPLSSTHRNLSVLSKAGLAYLAGSWSQLTTLIFAPAAIRNILAPARPLRNIKSSGNLVEISVAKQKLF